MNLIWKEKELKTMGDMMSTILAITDPKEAEEFMSLYRSINPYASENIGYMCGHFDPNTCQEKLRLFDTAHPIFGRKTPTPEEAFEAGRKMAQSHE